MPTPKPKETRNEYMGRCVPQCMKEGLDQRAAVGKCYGMFDQHRKAARRRGSKSRG